MSDRFETDATSAERAALLAICQPGASERSAARLLGITPSALRGRLRRLYRRLGVNTAAQAIYVVRLGLLQEHEERSQTEISEISGT